MLTGCRDFSSRCSRQIIYNKFHESQCVIGLREPANKPHLGCGDTEMKEACGERKNDCSGSDTVHHSRGSLERLAGRKPPG
jgi:hypothetical protein